MAHNPPIFPPGPIPPHYVVTPGRLEALDQYASESLDWVGGGTYTPETPIMIGGKGVTLRGVSCQIKGIVSTGQDSKGMTLAASATPSFGTPRPRTIVVPLRNVSETDGLATKTYEHIFDPYGIKSVRTAQGSWLFTIPSLRMHNGATIKRARFRWRSGAQPAVLTQNAMPWIRLLRIKNTGVVPSDYSPTNILELWKVQSRANSTAYVVGDIVHSTGGGSWEGSNGHQYRCVVAGMSAAAQPAMSTTDGADQVDGGVTWRVEPGWNNPFLHYSMPPVPLNLDVAVYHNDGLVQEIVHPVNLNPTIDTDNYEYAFEVLDPGIYGNIYHSLIIDIENLTSLKEP
jgi:hypothetical protein